MMGYSFLSGLYPMLGEYSNNHGQPEIPTKQEQDMESLPKMVNDK
jgi:hypothetical protein